MTYSVVTLFERDMDRLHAEINLYKDETLLWKTIGTTTNTAGNLCLHLVGNLNHFIGAVLGNSGYVREREAEFTLKNIPKRELLTSIFDVKKTMIHTLETLSPEDLKSDYPLQPFGYPISTEYFLLHLSGHLNYHLGQINYHRRTVE